MERRTIIKWIITNNGTPQNVCALMQNKVQNTTFPKKYLTFTPMNMDDRVKPKAS